jgi:hypothetical protein
VLEPIVGHSNLWSQGDAIAFPNATSGQSARETFGLRRQPPVFPFVIADDEGYAVWTDLGTLIQGPLSGLLSFLRYACDFPSVLPGAATARQLIGAGSGAKAPVLGSRAPGYGWIEKIRLEGAAPYQSDPEGESTERPERAKIDQRFDVAGPSDRRDGLVDDHQHTNDGRARMKFRMLHRPGQDADRRGTDGKP